MSARDVEERIEELEERIDRRTENGGNGDDAYYLDMRVKGSLRRLRGEFKRGKPDCYSPISDRNKHLILDFVENMRAQEGIENHRYKAYLDKLRKVAYLCDKNFDDMCNRDDMIDLVNRLKDMPWSERTTVDYQVAVKRFFKWLIDEDANQYPPEIRWIDTELKKEKRNRLSRDQLITEENLKDLLEATDSVRDRAMLWVLWEGGVRIGELLGMSYGDVTFNEELVWLKLDGKTGEREVPLKRCYNVLQQYMDSHPTQDPENLLWIGERGSPLKRNSVARQLNRLQERSDLDKDIWPHLFRHSAVTRDAPEMPEQVLKKKYGWVNSSTQLETYSQLIKEDLEKAVREMYGLDSGEEKVLDNENQTEVKEALDSGDRKDESSFRSPSELYNTHADIRKRYRDGEISYTEYVSELETILRETNIWKPPSYEKVKKILKTLYKIGAVAKREKSDEKASVFWTINPQLLQDADAEAALRYYLPGEEKVEGWPKIV